ncbi:hypothetical protein AALA69_01285 [Eggerthellaceae bacterium 24-137]
MTNRNCVQRLFARWTAGAVACAMALALCPSIAWATEPVIDEATVAESTEIATVPEEAAAAVGEAEGEADSAAKGAGEPTEVAPTDPEFADPEDLATEVAPRESDKDASDDLPQEEKLTSMTISIYEMVYYEDPTFNDPSCLRLMEERTVEGLKVGQTIELWDYVDPPEGFLFFDGWPRNPVMSENPDENKVQIHYFRYQSPSVINYYLVGEAAGVPLAKDAPIINDVDGVPVSFWKMGSYDVENLTIGAEITSDECAVPLDHLVYLASDKSSIAVEPLASHNEINLFYTIDTATTLPDDNLVESAPVTGQPDQPGGGETGEGGSNEVAGPDQNGSPTGGGSQTDTSAEGGDEPSAPGTNVSPEGADTEVSSGDPAADPSNADGVEEGTVVIEDDESPLAAEYQGTLTLPQTNDRASGVAGVLAAFGAVSLGAAALAARRRKDLRS